MIRNLTSFLFLQFFINLIFSQAPEIEWQNTIGGSSYDYCTSAQQTSDGGYILAGYSQSGISGDKTETSLGGYDYWIIKLDPSGTVQWQNTIGGSSDEGIFGIIIIKQTPDGGFILGGSSLSGISGDKTEAKIGNYDYWLLKLDAFGGIIWQNTIGGNQADELFSLELTSDGGYIIGGMSFSGNSGDKTEGSHGNSDYWVLKLNSTGNIQWQNTIGGSGWEYFKSIHETADGGYIIGGDSYSGISGDKSEASNGENDYWVVKLNSSGVVQWDNSIGGSSFDYLYSLQLTNDGGYILGGHSYSDISGDKTEANFDLSNFWIVKLNSTGGIEWQNSLGGNGFESFGLVLQSSDGGYILGGISESNISGDKTEAHIGENDYWLIKLNTIGNVEWDKTYGGIDDDNLISVQQTEDGGFILGGYSFSGATGNKTQTSHGLSDYWVIKIFPEGCVISPEICNTIDDDCNGDIDDGVTETISISTTGATTFCSGNSVTLTATHSGTSIQWKKNGVNISGATSSTYSATTTGTYSAQTSSACDTEISNEIFVQVNKKPNAFIYADGPTSFCAGGSVTLIANAGGGLSYQWYKGTSPIAGATNINYVATTTGNYKCLVTKIVSGCNKQSNAIAVAVTCKEGLPEGDAGEELILNNDITIYPNPSSDKIIITHSSAILTTLHSPLTITDLSGKTIAQLNITSSETEIDISNYSSGIYFVKMIIDDKQLTEKFIKQ